MRVPTLAALKRLLDRISAMVEAVRRHALRATLADCDRAARLVDPLLTLSKLESGAATALAPLDLAVLARRMAAERAPAALQRQQTLSLDAPAPSVVADNDDLLSALLRNLIDNTLRHRPDAAAIQLSVRRVGERVLLQVEDSGPGLAEADPDWPGKRFFRLLGSGQTGSGLGWSIVRRIAASPHRRIAESPRRTALPCRCPARSRWGIWW
jgi:two-component system sensor histidine kinase QseC